VGAYVCEIIPYRSKLAYGNIDVKSHEFLESQVFCIECVTKGEKEEEIGWRWKESGNVKAREGGREGGVE
jgi:hypothetical protein